MRLDRKLTLLREQRGITVAKAARAAGVRVKTMLSYENGTAIPKVKTIIRLAEFYGFSVEELFGKAISEVSAISAESAKPQTESTRPNAATSNGKKLNGETLDNITPDKEAL